LCQKLITTMKELTKREDQIMQIVWRLKAAFIKDIVAEFPEPQPHYNTVAGDIKEKFFDNSFPKMLSHFAKKEGLSEKQREELINIIKNQS